MNSQPSEPVALECGADISRGHTAPRGGRRRPLSHGTSQRESPCGNPRRSGSGSGASLHTGRFPRLQTRCAAPR